MRKFAGLLVGSLALAGCIPAPLGTYYKPSYDSANVRYSGNMCHGGAGAPATMEVALADGVTLSVSAVDAQGGAAKTSAAPVTLALTLNIPERAKVQFGSERIDIVADGHDVTFHAPMLQVAASKRIAASAPFDPKRDGPTPELFAADPWRVADFDSSTFVRHSIPNFRPARIQVQLPGLRIVDGSGQRDVPPLSLEADAVQLARAAGVGPTVYATAQASAAVARQHEECTRNPQRTREQCQQILDFHERGFDVDQGGARYTGRWWVLGPGSPFRGDLTIEQKTPVGWQLAPAEVRVRDAAAASSTQAGIDVVTVTVRYRAPFGSAFIGVHSDPTLADTRLSLGIPLPPVAGGAAARHYTVRLPDISINGRLIGLRPIEFERRSFEVGVLPFNC